MLIMLLTLIILGLYFVEIPTGNRDVSNVILGTIISAIVHAISDLFKKGAQQ